MSRQPAAFMSYVRFDDEHEGGQLTQFRERLAAEVRLQTGQEFPIFQDRNDIAWGQHWQTRINETLDAVTLLIPILTPSFFRSPPCREELARFLERERRLGRQDLILPVYYVGAPELDDPARREADELAQVLSSRQYADWRELRFEPFASPLVRKALAQLAARLRDSFWHPPAAPAAQPGQAGQAPAKAPSSRAAGVEPSGAATAPGTAKQEPPTHVVDAFPQRGDFSTIGEAIAAAHPGDRIMIRPGLYRENLVLDKALELLGNGHVSDIVVQGHGLPTLVFQANFGRVANLTLRQVDGDDHAYGVDISQGRLELEGCDISSRSSTGVSIRNGADPRLRRNRIHDNKYAGVDIYANALGTLEDNDIAGNGYSGVEVSTSADPTLRRNQIRDNKSTGVYVHDDGLGTLEDNDISGNSLEGMQIRTGGNPTVRGNRVNGNKLVAVAVAEGGRGVVEDNDLTANDQGAWNISEDSMGNVKRSGNRE